MLMWWVCEKINFKWLVVLIIFQYSSDMHQWVMWLCYKPCMFCFHCMATTAPKETKLLSQWCHSWPYNICTFSYDTFYPRMHRGTVTTHSHAETGCMSRCNWQHFCTSPRIQVSSEKIEITKVFPTEVMALSWILEQPECCVTTLE